MQSKVKIRLSSSTDYLEYRQKIKNVFRYKSKVFVTHSLAFSSSKRKGKPLREVVLFYLKKKLKKNNGKPQKKKMLCLFGENTKTNKYPQNVKANCIKA